MNPEQSERLSTRALRLIEAVAQLESDARNGHLSYAQADVRIATMLAAARGQICAIGCPCERHAHQVHGAEAEELRAGIERIVDIDDVDDWRHALRELLDRVDARDSLSYRERRGL